MNLFGIKDPFLIWNDKMWIAWIQYGRYPKYFLKRFIVAQKRNLKFVGYHNGVRHLRYVK